ncbi:MAG: discoidin domain-containing protein [Prevotellaceae bacterium]|jgi:hypothetical protein|nr:discoidin domain-containing protein [Prevotellaceae bacterium]
MSIKNIITQAFVSLLLISCGGMNDNIQEYLDRGETNYIGKADSIKIFGGKERVQIKWQINDDPRIETLKVVWNERSDSIIVPVNRSNIDADGYLNHIIEIPEGYYTFEVCHLGLGYRSIRETAYGASYGEVYRAKLQTRRVKNLTAFYDRIEIEWHLPSDNEQRSTLRYETAAGTAAEINVPSNENTTTINNGKLGGDLSVVSWYLPEPQALDELNSDTAEMKFPEFFRLNRAGWTATASDSNDGDGGGVNSLFNEDDNTHWHNDYGAGLPHWLEIDMKGEKNVKAISVKRRGGDLKKVVIKTRTGGGSWIERGELSYPSSSDTALLTLTFDTFIRAAEIRLEITESYREPHTPIREVVVIGNND